MILISVVENNIAISFDQIIKEGTIEVEKIKKDKKEPIRIANTDFVRIPIEEKGRYKVKVYFGEKHYSKTVEI